MELDQIKTIYEKQLSNVSAGDLRDIRYSLEWCYFSKYVHNKKTRILDAGCGNGKISYLLMSDGFKNIHGIDLFDEAPFEYVDGAFVGGDWYRQACIENMPFEEELFDFIISKSVIYYCSDFEQAILELKRVLKSGGVVCISGHTKYSIDTILRKIKLKFNLLSAQHLHGVNFRSTSYLKKKLIENGFELMEVDGYGNIFWDFFLRALSYIARHFLHLEWYGLKKRISKNVLWRRCKSVFGYHYVIVARKISE